MKNPRCARKIEWFMNNQDFLLRSRLAQRLSPSQQAKRHLPAELVHSPLLESGYNPFSMSSVGASGTGNAKYRRVLVTNKTAHDGRRDVISSTR